MPLDEYADSPAHLAPAGPEEPPAGKGPGSSLTGRRRILTSAAVAITAIAGVTGAHAASAEGKPAAETPQPSASTFDSALWQRQEALRHLREWIEAQPGIKSSGYVLSINDPDAGSTVLVWHGPPDRMQRQIIDEARRRNIPTSIKQCKYSMDDLERAVQQLITIDSGTGVFQNFKVSGVATFGLGDNVDFDGVTVQGNYIHPPAEGIPAADAALAQVLTAKTGVAVAIDHDEGELL
jgi:hypothetical protein